MYTRYGAIEASTPCGLELYAALRCGGLQGMAIPSILSGYHEDDKFLMLAIGDDRTSFF